MNETKQLMLTDYKEIVDKIHNEKTSDTKILEIYYEERDKVRDKIFKCDQAIMENNIKKIQLTAENKREFNRNLLYGGEFILSAGISMVILIMTFNFDKDSTLTSTTGRNNVNNFLSKFFWKK